MLGATAVKSVNPHSRWQSSGNTACMRPPALTSLPNLVRLPLEVRRATFTGLAVFDGAKFGSHASFERATFHPEEGGASFRESRVLPSDGLYAWPPGWGLGKAVDHEFPVVRLNGDDRR
jgi:Pentapeptide repeats (9 copies)